jgi:hypothetical protein
MNKRKRSRKQQSYKMRGCNKTRSNRKYYSGGDVSKLAYDPSSKLMYPPNPFLAYTGEGGYKNTNAANPIYPNTGALAKGMQWINSNVMHGGGCGDGTCGLTPPPMQSGGVGIGLAGPGGGIGCSTTNHGLKYPDGLVGKPWTPNSDSWPANKGVPPGGANHFQLNTYKNDISRQMKDVGAAFPFSGGRKMKKRKNTTHRRQRAGSSFLPQDFVNLGRQLNFGLGSAYNGLMGYRAPTNPLPWKGQLTNTPNLTTMRAFVR